jgi:signal transduction histidine kinase
MTFSVLSHVLLSAGAALTIPQDIVDVNLRRAQVSAFCAPKALHCPFMAQPSVVQHRHLQGVYSLLDDLQVGFVLVDPDAQVIHASYWLRRLMPRRATKGSGQDLLGAALFADLCQPVLAGQSSGERWREAELDCRDEGAPLQVSIRSTQVEFEDGRFGALLSLHDVSSEVGLHKQNKALLEKQKQINANLRKEIAKQLREHEDDIGQLNEILQIAPAIFASFMAEAGGAISQVEAVLADGPTDENLAITLRELHTLKGNARSLGLNYIGGRAHSVEDLLMHVQNEAVEKRAQLITDLAELARDLRRAKNRASFVRSRLGSVAAPMVDVQQYQILGEADVVLREALACLPEGSEAYELVAKATRMVHSSSQIELQELFEFLKAAAAKVSTSLVADCPLIDTTGGEIKISPAVYAALAAALPHIVRNAVSHGIEGAEQRLEAGKTAVGLINIDAARDESELRIRIADDGRGIDTSHLKAVAMEQGLPEPTTSAEFAALLLRPGVSTMDAVDLDTGRGMGSAAANEVITELGGSITIESVAGQGSTFTICVPL